MSVLHCVSLWRDAKNKITYKVNRLSVYLLGNIQSASYLDANVMMPILINYFAVIIFVPI